MNIRNLIPKDKFDIETAEKLQNYSYEQIKPIIPDLLEWLQDRNWPVSRPIALYLETITEEIYSEILTILKANDEVWKYWIILTFGGTIQNPEVRNEIIRIANNPTPAEINEEVQEVAKEIAIERNWI